ncbi:MAG: methyltransferase domain-containing protein [Nanoarchaeota archaeon]|nr:methyltransferase domain-containing protein [Nanoarchaeota archaeon]
MFRSKKPKTIALFSYSEALVKALSKYIKNLVPDLNIMNYSGTDLKFAIEGMLKNPPDILLLGVLLNDKEMDLIGKGNISPEKLDYVAKKIAPVISKFRKISSKTKIIGFDNSVFTSIYLESGADYFISCRILERQFLNTLIKVIKKERLSPEDKNIVYEKKEFYDSVVDIFDERSKITADTDKEIKFLTKELNKYGCRKVLDAGCGNGRLSIPLTESGFHMFNITGIDVSPKLIKQAIEKSRWVENKPEFIKADLLNLPFKNNSFDAVIMMWHVLCDMRTRRTELIRSLNSVLKNNGILIFDFPDKAKYIQIDKKGIYRDEGRGFKKYIGIVPQINEIMSLLEHLGFKNIKYERVKWGIHKFVVTARKEGFF